MEVVIAVLAFGALIGFARLSGATRANNHSLARGVLYELAALRGIPPRIDKLVDAKGLDLVERGYAVTVAVGTKTPFWECRVAIPPPGMPAFTVTCEGLVHTTIQCVDPGLGELIERWVREHRESLIDVTIRAFPTVLAFRRHAHATRAVEGLDADIKCAVDLAKLDMFGLQLLEQLPNGTFHTGEEPYVTLDGPGDLQVGLSRSGDTACTYIRTTFTADRPSEAKIGELGARLDVGTRHITLVWPRVQRDPQRIDAAIELLRSLPRGPSLGAYR